jgi:hypothetical protein
VNRDLFPFPSPFPYLCTVGSKALRLWLAGASASMLAGCATADLRPGIVRHETPKQIWSRFHGPGVRIQARVIATSNARMIQPVVTLSDSAYLVVGDIGDDGTLRIIYPSRPGEPNLVRRDERFEAPRFQPRVVLPFMPTAFSLTRTAPGYTFAIASSLPLDLTKLAEGDRWSVFDIYHSEFMMDPRPAITDLVSAISPDVGQISISFVPYAWGFVGPRASMAQRSLDQQRRRLPRRPPQ